MKKETVIHIPARGCHNCRLHCVNHKECDSPYPCKQGMEWRPRIDPKENKGYCGNPITSEDTCNILVKKKTCKGCKFFIIETNTNKD